MSITIDLTNYRENFSARIPEGRYRVVVDYFDEDQSRKGDKMFVIGLRVVEGEEAGAMLVERLTQTEKALFRTANFLQALNLPVTKSKKSYPVSAFVGRVLEVDVADGEPWQGSIKSEVKGFLKARKVEKPAEDPVADAGQQEPVDATEPVELDEDGDEALDLDDIDVEDLG